MPGGRGFEPHEENPGIGFRSAARCIQPACAQAVARELRAMKRVRERWAWAPGKGPEDSGLEVDVRCEIPNNVLLIDDFSELFDRFSIGSNDLTR